MAKNRLLERVGHISDWDVSRVTDMSELFSEMELFNDNLNDWNVSNVTSMNYMFYNAKILIDLYIIGMYRM